MRSSNTKLSSDVEEKRARIADESRQRRLSEEAHRRTLQREHTARIKAARSGTAARVVPAASDIEALPFLECSSQRSLVLPYKLRARERWVRLREIEVGW